MKNFRKLVWAVALTGCAGGSSVELARSSTDVADAKTEPRPKVADQKIIFIVNDESGNAELQQFGSGGLPLYNATTFAAGTHLDIDWALSRFKDCKGRTTKTNDNDSPVTVMIKNDADPGKVVEYKFKVTAIANKTLSATGRVNVPLAGNSFSVRAFYDDGKCQAEDPKKGTTSYKFDMRVWDPTVVEFKKEGAPFVNGVQVDGTKPIAIGRKGGVLVVKSDPARFQKPCDLVGKDDGSEFHNKMRLNQTVAVSYQGHSLPYENGILEPSADKPYYFIIPTKSKTFSITLLRTVGAPENPLTFENKCRDLDNNYGNNYNFTLN
jgi:hypothetical protein